MPENSHKDKTALPFIGDASDGLGGILNHLPDLVCITSSDGYFKELNLAWEKTLGFSIQELKSLPFMEFIHPDDRKLTQTMTRQQDQDCPTRNFQNRYRCRDGSYRTIEWHAVPVYNDIRIAVGRDITKRKETEIKLDESRKMLLAIFEGISDPLILLDARFRIRLMNQAANLYYGIPKSQSIKGICCFRALMGKKRPCDGCRVSEAARDRAHLCFERRGFMNPEKKEQVTIYPVDSPDGSNNSLMLLRINDVTELRNMEEGLARADRMIALGTLVSGVAHEINNPNSYIMMNIQHLINSWQSISPILAAFYRENGEFSVGGIPYSEMKNELPELMAGMEKGSRRINQIIKDLKDYACSDDMSLNDRVDMSRVIQNALKATAQSVNEATDCLECCVDRDIPSITGNSRQMEQVMINLIQNACQSLPDRSKSIRISAGVPVTRGGILIEVQDQGNGIPQDQLPKVTKPFFTTRRTSGGTGLGLSISSDIIKKHGGRLSISSCEGSGSCFQVYLPFDHQEKSVKILIVDDDPGVRKILAAQLKRDPRFCISEAGGGSEALLQIGQSIPDLLILDIHMPDIDGVRVCSLIKKRPELSCIKVIAVTGFFSSEKTREIMELGFETVLRKPVDKQTLFKTIDRLMEAGS